MDDKKKRLQAVIDAHSLFNTKKPELLLFNPYNNAFGSQSLGLFSRCIPSKVFFNRYYAEGYVDGLCCPEVVALHELAHFYHCDQLGVFLYSQTSSGEIEKFANDFVIKWLPTYVDMAGLSLAIDVAAEIEKIEEGVDLLMPV